jgi:3',5'-cyclic-AMP phosphodiesterase
VKLVHITDIHLTAEEGPLHGLDPQANFKACLEHVATHNADADRIVITGDLTHWGEAEAYEKLKGFLVDVATPIRLLIGNHDNRATFLSVFPDHPRDPNGFIQYSDKTPAGRFVFLDTNEPETHAGHLGPQRRDWLAAELDAARGANENVYLFMHHNPRDVLVNASDKLALRDQAEFRALLLEHGDTVRYVFFGHCHYPLSGTIAGIPFASLRGTNHQCVPSFPGGEKLQMAPLAPAYNVVLFDEPDVVIHTIDYGYQGPIELAGTGWRDWSKPIAAE